MKTNFKRLLSSLLSVMMLAALLPVSSMAAGETKAVKEDIDWENWLVPNWVETEEGLVNAPYSSYMDGATYYVNGPTNTDNDYEWWSAGAGPMNLTIDDVGQSADGAGDIATKTYVSGQLADIPTSDGKMWGFKGSKYYTGWMADTSVRAEFPEERWLGINDISAHVDTGYAVFTIDSVTGGADAIQNAYLAIKSVTWEWDFPYGDFWSNGFPITKEKYGHILNWVEPYASHVSGVKLTDYYNVTKGGKQTVAVPLKKLANSPDFKEVYGKLNNLSVSDFAAKRAMTTDLRYFTGMGIARKDTGKKQAFSITVSDLAIVDPIAPTEVDSGVEGDKVTIEFEATTDTDVEYKVKRTCNGAVTYIDAPELYIEDTIDTTKSYTYQVVAVDTKYGVEAASEPIFVGAEGVGLEKANMNWKDYVGEGGNSWMNYMEGEAYYVGSILGAHTADGPGWTYNNYGGAVYTAGGNFKPILNDGLSTTEGGKYNINAKMYNKIDASVTAEDLVDVPNMHGKAWGYQGMNYNGLRNVPDKSNVPEDVWFGVKDISSFEKGGYAVFTINGITGDAENAYLSITTLTDAWQFQTILGDLIAENLPPKKADFPDTVWGEHLQTAVNGAKLTDYYDVGRGGAQTVAVPLTKLLDDPDFEEFKNVSYDSLKAYLGREDVKLYFRPNLKLFSGMGVARCDSGSNKDFSAEISEMKIVALQAPTGLVSTKNADGSVTFTFNTTNDLDVTYKIARTVDGVTEYFDAPGSFTENNIDPKKSYTYEAYAYNADLGIYSAASEPVVVEPNYVSIEKANMNWKDYLSATEPWKNNMESTVFFVGPILGAHNGDTAGWTYNNYTGENFAAAGNFKPIINDALSTVENGKYSINSTIYDKVEGVTAENLKSVPTIGGKAWGYQGMNYNELRNYAGASALPKDMYLGVTSIKDYENTGYAVFTIENVSGDAENAFLSITTLTDEWQLQGITGEEIVAGGLPLTAEKYPNAQWLEHFMTAVNGAKLTDYYDTTVGGTQTVAVPLTKLLDAPDFEEVGGKDYTGLSNKVTDENFLEYFRPNLHLFSGMGVARVDSGSDLEFTAEISEMKIVSVEAPANFEAVVNEDGSVTATFDTTFDKDVTFKVLRECGEEKMYFDAQDGTYTDTTRDKTKTYTYKAVAVYDALSIETPSENVVTVGAEVTNYAKLYAGAKETKYIAAGEMTAKFFSSEKAATGYIAKYDAAGRLTGANLVAVPVSEEASTSLAGVALTDTVKVMLWADGEPVVDPIVAVEKPVKVLYIGDAQAVTYLDEIAAEDELDYEVTTLSADGAAIANALTTTYNVAVNGTADGTATINEILANDEWDYILVQEDKAVALSESAYAGYDNLAAVLATEGAEVKVVNGWSSEAAVEDDHDKLLAATEEMTAAIADTAEVVYSVALDLGMDMWEDDGALNDNGLYTTAITIYGAIAGVDNAKANGFAPSGVDIASIKEYI